MESDENWKEVISKIENIEQKYLELEDFLSNLTVPSRDSILEEIHKDIIRNHMVFRNIGTGKEEICGDKMENQSSKIQNLIQNTIENIKTNPVKKVLYLRKFLDKFIDISDSDKNVVIKSLKSTDNDDLRDKMESLTRIFKIKDLE